MKKYNYEFIETQYALMKVFLFDANENLLDISYSTNDNHLKIQMVLLEGYELPPETLNRIKVELPNNNILIDVLFLSKEQFNLSRGEWNPVNYEWLQHVLFSKAEVL